MRRRFLTSIVTTAATIIVAACAVSDITSVKPSSTDRSEVGIGATLLECPSNASATTSGLLTPLGGVLSVGGATVVVPEGALLEPVNVTVTVPASQYVEVEVSVSGVDHYTFELPVAITISYDRCSRSNIDHAPLSAWYIDSDSKALLAPMGGIDNKLLRTVTFTTGHLSGYALAN